MLDHLPIEELEDLSTRAMGVLRRAGCKTVGDIRRCGRQGLLQQPNCGRLTLNEIEWAIRGWEETAELVDTAERSVKALKVRAGPEHVKALEEMAVALIRLAFEAGSKR